MATRLMRVLKAMLTGKRVDPVHPAIHDAAKAIKKAEKAIRKVEKELDLGYVSMAGAISRCF